MVLVGHVTAAAGGRFQGRISVWGISVGLARRIWWRPIHPSSLHSSCLGEFAACRPPILRCFRTHHKFQQQQHFSCSTVANSGRGPATGNIHNGSGAPAIHDSAHRASFVASSKPQGTRPAARDAVKFVQNQLDKHRIKLSDYSPRQHRVLCPECDGGSTREKSLSVTVNEDRSTAWICHRASCGWSGYTKGPQGHFNKSKTFGAGQSNASGTTKASKSSFSKSSPKSPHSIESLNIKPELSDDVVEWFKQRGITKKTLQKQSVMEKATANGDIAIAFPYMRDGKIVNCKFRTVDKRFWQVEGAEKVLYGLDDIKNVKDIIFVEGEMDRLSLVEAGYTNCVSVPDGAPAKASLNGALPPPDEDKKYEYLFNCQEYFDQATRIVLATDSDEPGQALAEELARRLGRERCWRVNWPRREDGSVCKDANEVLQHLGSAAVRELIETSELYPIRGLFQFSQFFKELDDYYFLRLGDERGVSTGWRGLDDIYRVVPGELTVVTGVPNSGKSEWIDALCCNLNHEKRWTFALCSMENKVRVHARKLLEKHSKLPFFDAPYANSIKRMSKTELDKGKEWLNSSFFLIRCEDDELPSVDWVLNLAKAAVMRHGIRGLVIDPYNELDHQRPTSQTETEYVSQMLTRIKRFAQHHDCHVWFVAHPKQLQVWRGEAPGLYDISGSAHFINKCDNGIIIHRNRDPDAGPLDQVKVLVRKVRNKAAGTIGEACLQYNRATGEYSDLS